MAIKILNPDQSQVQEQAPPQVEVEAVEQAKDQLEITEMMVDVDELARLMEEMEEHKPKLKKIDELKKKLQSIAAEQDPKEEVVMVGVERVVTFTAAGESRVITKKSDLIGNLKAKIGYPALLELLKINLTDVDKYLSPDEQKAFIGKEEGSRKFGKYLTIEQAKKQKLID